MSAWDGSGAQAAALESLNIFGGGGFQFGLGNKSANRYAAKVRHLRRREYQDMVFSMKQAGLNPMLASGATPGHSAPSVAPTPNMSSGGIGSAYAAGKHAEASNRQAGVAEAKMPAERSLLEVQAQNTLYQRANILQQYDDVKARIANQESATALNNASTLKVLAEKGFIDKNSAKTVQETNKIMAELPGVKAHSDQAEKGYNLNPLNVGPYKLEHGKEKNDAAGKYHHEREIMKALNSSFDAVVNGLGNTVHGD